MRDLMLALLAVACLPSMAYANEAAHGSSAAHVPVAIPAAAAEPVTPPVDDGMPRLGTIQGIELPFKPLSARPKAPPSVPVVQPTPIAEASVKAIPADHGAPAPGAAPASKPIAPTRVAVTAPPADAEAARPPAKTSNDTRAPSEPSTTTVLPAASTLRPIFAAGRHRSSMGPRIIRSKDATGPVEASTREGAQSVVAKTASATGGDDQSLERLRQRLAEVFGSRDIGGATIQVSAKSSSGASGQPASVQAANGRTVKSSN